MSYTIRSAAYLTHNTINKNFERSALHTQKQHPEVFLGKGVLKICSKFTGEHPCRGVILITLLCKFIEIALRHGCSDVTLLHICTI